MKRLALSLLPLLTFGLLTSAQAVTFGGLNVVPNGAQNLNLDTGATDMPTGGTATDAASGLTLTGARMQLRPNQTLSAQNATIKTRRGATLNAGNIVYDLKNGTVTATSGVTFSDPRMQNLTAAQVVLYVKNGFIVASGGFQAARPALSGQALAFDPTTMQAAVAGPYKLTSTLWKKTGGAGSRLLLTWGGNYLSNAVDRPGADDLARFGTYLK